MSEYNQVDRKENRNCEKADAEEELRMCLQSEIVSEMMITSSSSSGVRKSKCKLCEKNKRLNEFTGYCTEESCRLTDVEDNYTTMPDTSEIGAHGGICICPDGKEFEVGVLTTDTSKIGCTNGISKLTLIGDGAQKKAECGNLVCDYCKHDGLLPFSFCHSYRTTDTDPPKYICNCFTEWEKNLDDKKKCEVPTDTNAHKECVEPYGMKCALCKPGFKLNDSGACVKTPCEAGCRQCRSSGCLVCEEEYTQNQGLESCIKTSEIMIPVGTLDADEFRRYITNCKYHRLQVVIGDELDDSDEIIIRCYMCHPGYVSTYDEKACVLPDSNHTEGLKNCRVLQRKTISETINADNQIIIVYGTETGKCAECLPKYVQNDKINNTQCIPGTKETCLICRDGYYPYKDTDGNKQCVSDVTK